MDNRLNATDRLRLMGFLCSFAWADLEVRDQERAFVKKVAKKLSLNAEELAQVDEWLSVPPPAEMVDPAKIPASQRKLVLDMARAMVVSDGEVAEAEQENLSLLEDLLR